MESPASIKKYEMPEEMSAEYLDVLCHFLSVQADSGYAAIQQLRTWLDHAPTAEDRWVIARIINEEMRRAWQMSKLLMELGRGNVVDEMLWKKTGEHKLESLNVPVETWPDAIVYLFFVTGVVAYYLDDFVDSTYAPLDRAVGQMIKEERLHRAFAVNKISDFIRDPENKTQFQQLAAKWLPRGLDNFGRSNSRADAQAIEYGIKRTPGAAMRDQYVTDLKVHMDKWGVPMPDLTVDRRFQ